MFAWFAAGGRRWRASHRPARSVMWIFLHSACLRWIQSRRDAGLVSRVDADNRGSCNARNTYLLYAALVAGKYFDSDAAALDGFTHLGNVSKPFCEKAANRCGFRIVLRPEVQKILQAIQIQTARRDEDMVRFLADVSIG